MTTNIPEKSVLQVSENPVVSQSFATRSWGSDETTVLKIATNKYWRNVWGMTPVRCQSGTSERKVWFDIASVCRFSRKLNSQPLLSHFYILLPPQRCITLHDEVNPFHLNSPFRYRSLYIWKSVHFVVCNFALNPQPCYVASLAEAIGGSTGFKEVGGTSILLLPTAERVDERGYARGAADMNGSVGQRPAG